MSEDQKDFGTWESELQNTELMPVKKSLTLAQELQIHIATLPRDYQHDAWLEALRLLAEAKYDVRGQSHLVHASKSFAYFDRLRAEDGQTPMLEFGEMYVIGGVGGYSYATYENFPSIMMTLFEPKQQRVWNEEDRIHARLPVPLSIPVLCIDSIINYKKG